MFVVIEGPDNSGKSTLAKYLADRIDFPLQHSGGPPKSDDEFAFRLDRLFRMDDVIFDRFPVISEAVYGPILSRESLITPTSKIRFFARKPIIIYCRPPLNVLMRVVDGHEVKDHETAAHVAAVKAHAMALIHRYDEVLYEYNPIYYDYTAGGPHMLDLIVRYLKCATCGVSV